ncbi:MAG: hypothetical protein JW889_06585 [Verrucomicrobia bacterium]|nr:hypothetical protein [Verrucomicrobiota bacterium]
MSTILDFYDGAYGPTVRIDIISHALLSQLKDVLQDLASGLAQEFEFHGLEGIASSSIKELVAEVVPSEPRVKLKVLSRKHEDPVFRWSNTREGWQTCADLVEKLAEDNRPGHQYLTNEHTDDALVEVCFLERPKEVYRE